MAAPVAEWRLKPPRGERENHPAPVLLRGPPTPRVDELSKLTLDVCMRQGVRITATKKRDAECISSAMSGYGSEVERDGRRWAVHFSASGTSELPAVLTALKDCLDENAIATVKVRIDGRAYAMEGMAEKPDSPAALEVPEGAG